MSRNSADSTAGSARSWTNESRSLALPAGAAAGEPPAAGRGLSIGQPARSALMLQVRARPVGFGRSGLNCPRLSSPTTTQLRRAAPAMLPWFGAPSMPFAGSDIEQDDCRPYGRAGVSAQGCCQPPPTRQRCPGQPNTGASRKSTATCHQQGPHRTECSEEPSLPSRAVLAWSSRRRGSGRHVWATLALRYKH